MCDVCSTSNLMEEHGFHICMDCGIQVGRVLNTNTEWYADVKEKYGSTRNRVGQQSDPLLAKTSMRTYVRQRNNQQGKHARIGARGVIRQHTWIAGVPYCERMLREVFRHIRDACAVLNINQSIVRRAEFIYTRTNTQAKARSSSKMGIVAAAVLIAAKQEGHPRSPVELSSVFSVSPAIITKGVNTVHSILHGSRLLQKKKNHVTTSVDFVPRFCSKMGLDAISTGIAIEIANMSLQKNIARHNTPPSVAGGVILFVISMIQAQKRVSKRTKEAIAKIAGVSVVTITKVRKELNKYRSHIVTDKERHILEKCHVQPF